MKGKGWHEKSECYCRSCDAGRGDSVSRAANSKSTASRDPELIDAQGYQKLVEQFAGNRCWDILGDVVRACRHEYPMLNELAKQYAPQGLKVVGVNLDDDGDLILMRRFLARYNRSSQLSEKGRRRRGFPANSAGWWNGALPASVFYARDGRQAGHVLGEGSRETYETAIRALLAAGTN